MEKQVFELKTLHAQEINSLIAEVNQLKNSMKSGVKRNS